MPFAVTTVRSQIEALEKLAGQVRRASIKPRVVLAARMITAGCPARDDRCELDAIYRAVKSGDSRVPGLANGVRYVSDPQAADWFAGPAKLLQMCTVGACAGDCDEVSGLIAALAAALGFSVGLRVWGPANSSEYQHVYACVAVPKLKPPSDPRKWLAMDTTVEEAYVGWDPPRGHFLTAKL